MAFKFDPAKIAKLDDPGRFETLVPEVMWEAFGLADPAVIVEVGAGTGMFAARFSAKAPNAIVYAADTSDEMLQWMREKRPEVSSGKVIPLKAEETRVPVPDETADGVYMISVHHELEDPAASYEDAFRMLKPEGRILVVDWAPIETPKGPPLSIRATPAQLVAALEDAGFTEVRSVAGLPWHSMAVGAKPRG